jgi:hypothetical protein
MPVNARHPSQGLAVDVYRRQHHTEIFAIPARTVEIDPSGRVFQGFVCADPEDPDRLTARFTYTGAGASNDYTISPEPGAPGITVQVPSLKDAVAKAVGWIRDGSPMGERR